MTAPEPDGTTNYDRARNLVKNVRPHETDLGRGLVFAVLAVADAIREAAALPPGVVGDLGPEVREALGRYLAGREKR